MSAFDIKRAFDQVWLQGALVKLKLMGNKENTLIVVSTIPELLQIFWCWEKEFLDFDLEQ